MVHPQPHLPIENDLQVIWPVVVLAGGVIEVCDVVDVEGDLVLLAIHDKMYIAMHARHDGLVDAPAHKQACMAVDA